jgi:ABC-type transporter Mla maintaining outer membrane lipid asymmetry ATPase subunit MlaF
LFSSEKNSEVDKKVALWLTNCALFDSFLVYKNINPATNLRYKEFLLQVAKAWAADKMEMSQPDSDRHNTSRTVSSYPT